MNLEQIFEEYADEDDGLYHKGAFYKLEEIEYSFNKVVIKRNFCIAKNDWKVSIATNEEIKSIVKCSESWA